MLSLRSEDSVLGTHPFSFRDYSVTHQALGVGAPYLFQDLASSQWNGCIHFGGPNSLLHITRTGAIQI